jgi:ATP-dependent protease Clp ATPase subunit
MREKTCALCGKKKENTELIFKSYGKDGNIICKKCVKTCSVLLKRHERKKIYGRDWEKIKNEYSPRKIFSMLKKNVVGHEEFCKILSVTAYNYLKNVFSPNNEESPTIIMVLGPTGSGKTHTCTMLGKVLEEIFGRFAHGIGNCGSMSSTGYVGTSPKDTVQSLYQEFERENGKGDPGNFFGMVIYDEIDKTARDSKNKGGDISRIGVQREFLNLLDKGTIEVQSGSNDFFAGGGKKQKIPSKNLMFIFCGAFENLKDWENEEEGLSNFGKPMLILPKAARRNHGMGKRIKSLINYGMMKEFLGRMETIYQLGALSDENLTEIAEEHVLKAQRKKLLKENVHLEWNRDVIQRLVMVAKDSKTGARGINAAVITTLGNASYELFGRDDPQPVKLTILPCEEFFLKTEISPRS